ncbi:MAG: hypothetical protein WA667_06510, partial [Candidatus Nitrosopolaris sp.]
FLGVQLLQKYGYVSAVNWDKLGNDTSTHIQHWATTADITNLHGLFHTLGIPVSGGRNFKPNFKSGIPVSGGRNFKPNFKSFVIHAT